MLPGAKVAPKPKPPPRPIESVAPDHEHAAA
jgi:hypothetical protein